MANPLKVLTQLSASSEAQFAEVVEMMKTLTVSGGDVKFTNAAGEISGSGALKNAGAAQLGSTLAVAGDANLASKLDVKGAAALSSSLGVVGAADLQSTLAVAGNADLNGELDVQEAANFQDNVDVAGYMKVVGEMSGSAALNIGGAAHVAGAAQFDSSLSVDGNADVDGTLAVVGNLSTQASASVAGDLDVNGLADIAGNLDVHGNAVIYGNLDVKGTMTTIESTTVTVADANIQLATVASPTDSTADGAGITILGATNKTFQWNNDGSGFTSSEDMNLAADHAYKIDGKKALELDSNSNTVLTKDGGSQKVIVGDEAVSLGQDNTYNITVGQIGSTEYGIKLKGETTLTDSLHVLGNSNLDSAVVAGDTLSVTGVATFSSDITASANVNVAGNIVLDSTSEIIMGGQRKLFITDAADVASGEAGSYDDVRLQNKSGADWSRVNLQFGYGQLEASTALGLNAPDVYVNGIAHLGNSLEVSGIATFQSDVSASAGVDVAGNMNLHAGSIYKIADINVAQLDENGRIIIAQTPSYLDEEGNNVHPGQLKVADGFVMLRKADNYVIAESGKVEIAANWIKLSGPTDVALGDFKVGNGDISGSYGIEIGAQASFLGNTVAFYTSEAGNNIAKFDAEITGTLGLDMTGNASFHNDVSMDAALNLSGSEFVNITTPVVDGKYNVNDAIRALDAKAGQQASNINSNYAALRYLDSKNFDAQGMASFTSSFAAADIEQVAVDVLVQAGGSGPWTNDLLSVQVKAAGAYVGFEISAPAMGASDKVRIIAVKESGSLA